MVFGKLFGNKQQEPVGDDSDLRLRDLRPGCLVDYDLETWQVAAQHKYDYDGDIHTEWELVSGNNRAYLELAEEDGEQWALARKISLGKIKENVVAEIKQNEDPPQRIEFDGETWYADEGGAGFYMENGGNSREGFLYWSYSDESEKRFVTIEQWGDNDFEAGAGSMVEEYQFSNILPPA